MNRNDVPLGFGFALVQNPEAMKYFNAIPFSYDEAGAAAAKLRSARSGAELAAIYRSWSEFSRKNLRKAAEAARRSAGQGGVK